MPKEIPKAGINKGWFKKGHSGWNWEKDVKYRGLHKWVNEHINKPKTCKKCGETKSIDLANITGVYERDFSNWEYLCRKHHMESDGRYEKLLLRNKSDNPSIKRWNIK